MLLIKFEVNSSSLDALKQFTYLCIVSGPEFAYSAAFMIATTLGLWQSGHHVFQTFIADPERLPPAVRRQAEAQHESGAKDTSMLLDELSEACETYLQKPVYRAILTASQP